MQPSGNAGSGKAGRGKRFSPLWKTTLCRDFPLGKCRFSSKDCIFAHGEGDLRPSPDLTRTSICPTWLRSGQCDKKNCRYAHTFEELRQEKRLIKTQLCKFFMSSSGCIVGSACRFAHGPHELCKSAEAVQRQSRREAFMQTAPRREAFMQTAPCQSPSVMGFMHSGLYGQAAPCIFWGGFALGLMKTEPASHNQVHSRSQLPRSAKARSLSPKLTKRGLRLQASMDGTTPVVSNVEKIRAAMSRRQSQGSDTATTSASTTSEGEEEPPASASNISEEAEHRLVIRNTFIDFDVSKVREHRRSKSV
eukprot:TRINITY_DN7818_c0_g1_i1.p1 TRINITY_DN7818_c0_g1~~TRINITY_DN7818_c0_g1_i1.p1  ORF type:complete len:306 (+),score=40.16 TRINITY_DN7818_c0_g1_i1:145-1062(+)